MKNNCICYTPYLRNCIAYDHDFWYTCVKLLYLQAFFQFFKIFIFWVVEGVKGQKIVQNDKKFCLSSSTSQEPYIISLSFMLHLHKMIISPGVFFYFFKIFIFWGVRGVKRQKLVQDDTKFCLLHSISQCNNVI